LRSMGVGGILVLLIYYGRLAAATAPRVLDKSCGCNPCLEAPSHGAERRLMWPKFCPPRPRPKATSSAAARKACGVPCGGCLPSWNFSSVTSTPTSAVGNGPPLAESHQAPTWAWKQVAHACCAEDLPSEWGVEAHNKQIVDGSNVLAPVEEHTVKYGSLSCPHNNQSMRAIHAGMPCGDEKLSVGGRHSLERMKVTCPLHHDAVTKGMEWRVIKWPVRKHRPDVFARWGSARKNQ